MRRWAVALVMLGAGCSDSDESTPAVEEPPYTGPTYYRDVAPIVLTKCAGCHSDGTTFAPMSLATYDDARAFSGIMARETEARRMPPWGALDTPECVPPR